MMASVFEHKIVICVPGNDDGEHGKADPGCVWRLSMTVELKDESDFESGLGCLSCGQI